MIILRWRVPGQGWRKNEAINACMTTGPYCAHYSSPKIIIIIVTVIIIVISIISMTTGPYCAHYSSGPKIIIIIDKNQMSIHSIFSFFLLLLQNMYHTSVTDLRHLVSRFFMSYFYFTHPHLCTPKVRELSWKFHKRYLLVGSSLFAPIT